MDSKHLQNGDSQPPKSEGKLRLYSMRYCPFAHRARLALSFKKVPYEIVNINLKNKPEWYLQINSEGHVPTLVDTDGKIIRDSNVIVNYLDEKYPDPPLYNKTTLERDLELIELYEKVVKVFSNCIHKKESKSLQEYVQELSDCLVDFEEELKLRKTPYFAGQNPGMVDIIMWPFVERAKALPLIYNELAEFDKEKFPNFLKWICRMKKQDFVDENSDPYEDFAKVVEASNSGTVDYDSISSD